MNKLWRPVLQIYFLLIAFFIVTIIACKSKKDLYNDKNTREFIDYLEFEKKLAEGKIQGNDLKKDTNNFHPLNYRINDKVMKRKD